jgi:hypothetical protein
LTGVLRLLLGGCVCAVQAQDRMVQLAYGILERFGLGASDEGEGPPGGADDGFTLPPTTSEYTQFAPLVVSTLKVGGGGARARAHGARGAGAGRGARHCTPPTDSLPSQNMPAAGRQAACSHCVA